jgi:hypothetical protein
LLALAESPSTPADPHLAACDRCRNEVEALRAVLGRLVTDDVPEPSPLFWDHFSERVRAAVAEERASAAPVWWSGWRSWTYAAGACAAMVVVVAVAWPNRPAAPVAATTPESAVVADAATEGSVLAPDEDWDLLVDVASGDAPDGIDTVLAPAAAELGVQDLSGDERSALASLLRAELDGRRADPGL